ncbi:hypothetical protein FHX81_7759 [Saccharothrix saharensis]|uniref:Uncharacterized protein n=1 Tax=Saccharothrix saharensis TaxID=571190 RepID=A0A543JR16_9PSEU|nr:hypothetical protein [Saccharothrix saharensis]TQM85280.1 hypothetical protein FHX81_7759 [Saccharothrix saharensis]
MIDHSVLITRMLAIELRAMRRGLGIHDARLPARMGSTAKRVFAVTDADSTTTVRWKVTGALEKALVRLLTHERGILTAAFNLSAENVLYRHRVEQYGKESGVGERTARRWADRSTEILAQVLLDTGVPGVRSTLWTDHLAMTLALDRSRAELLEVRRIVTAEDVSEIPLSLHVAGLSSGDLARHASFEVFHGGSLRIVGPESSSRLGLALKLPRILHAGEAHEYAMLVRLPARYAPAAHFVYVPPHTCTRVEIRVRFPHDAVPRGLTSIIDVHHQDVDDPAAGGVAVDMNDASEVHVEFAHPTPGLASGIRWQVPVHGEYGVALSSTSTSPGLVTVNRDAVTRYTVDPLRAT